MLAEAWRPFDGIAMWRPLAHKATIIGGLADRTNAVTGSKWSK